MRGLIDSLPAGAYAAVLSRDTHLKLRQDFTTDRKLVSTALHEAVRGGNGPKSAPAGTEGGRPFLLPHFDENRARLAVSTDSAFEETARALDPLPGEKTPQRMIVKLRKKRGEVLSTPVWTLTESAAAEAVKRPLRSAH